MHMKSNTRTNALSEVKNLKNAYDRIAQNFGKENYISATFILTMRLPLVCKIWSFEGIDDVISRHCTA